MRFHPIALLRAVHIVAGAFWVGGVFLNAVFLIPSIMAAGPAGGAVMKEMVQRRLPVFMNIVMGTSIFSGIWLYGWNSDGFHLAWIVTGTGLTFTFGALCAIATAAIGGIMIVPAVKRLGQLGAEIAAAGRPPSPEQAAEMGALQRPMLKGTRLGPAPLTAATDAMAVGRYV